MRDPAPTYKKNHAKDDVSNGNLSVSNDEDNDNDHGLFDNDRKEGDYETYPFPYHQERNSKDSQERSLVLTSKESAGSTHSNHIELESATVTNKNVTTKSEDLS